MKFSRRNFVAGMSAGLGMLAGIERWAGAAEAAKRVPAIQQFPTVEQIRARQPEAWKLVDAINGHRQQHSLPVIPLSPRLTAVAYWHAKELAERRPQETYGSLHSWSLDPRWQGGAYRADDKRTGPIMWEKPKEITGYRAAGFEICAADARDCAHAFQLWLESESHLDVILNRGVWSDPRWRWRALGAVYHKGYACAWFGNVADT